MPKPLYSKSFSVRLTIRKRRSVASALRMQNRSGFSRGSSGPLGMRNIAQRLFSKPSLSTMTRLNSTPSALTRSSLTPPFCLKFKPLREKVADSRSMRARVSMPPTGAVSTMTRSLRTSVLKGRKCMPPRLICASNFPSTKEMALRQREVWTEGSWISITTASRSSISSSSTRASTFQIFFERIRPKFNKIPAVFC